MLEPHATRTPHNASLWCVVPYRVSCRESNEVELCKSAVRCQRLLPFDRFSLYFPLFIGRQLWNMDFYSECAANVLLRPSQYTFGQ